MHFLNDRRARERDGRAVNVKEMGTILFNKGALRAMRVYAFRNLLKLPENFQLAAINHEKSPF